MFPLYTKTFGGKICKNLHSVSPGNILSKKFKMAPLKFSRQKHASKVSCKKMEKVKRQFGPWFRENRYDFLALLFVKPLNRICSPKHFDLSTLLHEIVFTC